MNYIDLGLPSGTLWADTNEEGYFTFDEAKEQFGDALPTIEQWQELINECEWLWSVKRMGMEVGGKNGNSIFLPATGYRAGSRLYNAGSGGYCWSSALSTGRPDDAYSVYFFSDDVFLSNYCRYNGRPVRLIKNK